MIAYVVLFFFSGFVLFNFLINRDGLSIALFLVVISLGFYFLDWMALLPIVLGGGLGIYLTKDKKRLNELGLVENKKIKSKIDLITDLVKERMRNEPMAKAMGFNEIAIDSLGAMEIASLPESTIATIVESYVSGKKSKMSDSYIFDLIEKHRSQIGSGELPSPLTLESYILYRLTLEHAHGIPVQDEFAIKAIRICRNYFEQ